MSHACLLGALEKLHSQNWRTSFPVLNLALGIVAGIILVESKLSFNYGSDVKLVVVCSLGSGKNTARVRGWISIGAAHITSVESEALWVKNIH